MPIKKMRTSLSVDEKIWILDHWKGNPHILQNKIALNFLAKLKKQLTEHVPPKSLKKRSILSLFESRSRAWKKKNLKIWYLLATMMKIKWSSWVYYRNWGGKSPKKPQIQSYIKKFFQNNKKLFARRLKKIKHLILLISFA